MRWNVTISPLYVQMLKLSWCVMDSAKCILDHLHPSVHPQVSRCEHIKFRKPRKESSYFALETFIFPSLVFFFIIIMYYYILNCVRYSNPITGLERLLGFQEVEAPRISRQ